MQKKLIPISIMLFFFILNSAHAWAQSEEDVFPSKKHQWINDFANLINAQDAITIESLCKSIYEEELATIVVCTIDSIPKVREEYENVVLYGTDLFNYWGVGRKGINDGLLILISKKERKTAICTGYLTEYFLPDAEAGRILRTFMIPEFKIGEFGKGIIRGIIKARKVMLKNRKVMYPEKYRN